MRSYKVVQVADLLAASSSEFVAHELSSFTCPLNAEVQTFLRDSAVDFTKRTTSVTHLVYDADTRECLAYFTLTHKPFSIESAALSKTQCKRIERFAKRSDKLGTYTVSAFLIAQIGKNFSVDATRRMPGAELLVEALDRIALAQHEIGGQVVFLECEASNAKLRAFYERNAFVACGERTDETDGITYLQMFRFLK